MQRNFPSSFLRHRTRPKPPIFVTDYLSPPKSLSSPSILANSGHSDTANRSLVQCQPRVPPLVCLTMSSQPLLQATPGTSLEFINCPTRQSNCSVHANIEFFNKASESPSQPESSPRSSSQTNGPSYHG